MCSWYSCVHVFLGCQRLPRGILGYLNVFVGVVSAATRRVWVAMVWVVARTCFGVALGFALCYGVVSYRFGFCG